MIPELTPIGRVHSPVTDPKKMVRGGVAATIELDPLYADGLLNIEEHSHLWILTWFHLSDRETTELVGLALLDRKVGAEEVYGTIESRFGDAAARTLRRCNAGAHTGIAGDLDELAKDAGRFARQLETA